MAELLKKPGCSHQFEENSRCVPVVRNTYECDNCGACWEDEWSCGCDDECPSCDLDISPTDSEEIGEACACDYLGSS